MLQALWSASSGMLAQQMSMDTVANNVSNVNTAGYKKSRVEFQDLLYSEIRSPERTTLAGQVVENGLQVGSGTRPAVTIQLFEQGALQPTGNATDLALTGNAFFEVDLPDGSKAYTRNGSFTIDAEGNLVTANGARLSVEGQQGPLSAAARLSIDSLGNISQEDTEQGEDSEVQQVGKLNIATFTNPAGLERTGSNLYVETANSGAAEAAKSYTLSQGYIETSNVQIAEEMVSLMMAQRAYELASRAIKTTDGMLGIANQMLKR